MNIRVKQWIQQVEETEGRTLEPEVIQAIILVDKYAIEFKLMGEKDATEGRNAFSDNEFIEWGNKQMPCDSDTAAVLAELMQLHYMGGYKGGAE